jgi:uncharacterized protein (TIGR00730 family)
VRVAVFTGSSAGVPAHAAAAAAFATDLAEAGVGIVYGGASVGLMGVVADAALAVGGEVIGVIPEHLFDKEIAHEGLTRLDTVIGMHARKARMAELSDAFIALPGGAGTLEELFEVWTWGQIGLHAKPVAIGDFDGFYQPMITQLTVMVEAGYIKQSYLARLGIVHTAEEFLAFVASYQPPPLKWTNQPPVSA